MAEPPPGPGPASFFPPPVPVAGSDGGGGGGADENGASEDALLFWSLFLNLACLAVAFGMGYAIKRAHFHYLHEAGAALLLGVVVGAVVQAGDASKRQSFQNLVDFHPEVFFLVLLPPIIFESGYSMKPKFFFANFGAICGLAFAGTFVSTVIVGVVVWAAGAMGMVYKLPLLHALIFGSLISATDPVTVLAIFQELGVNVNLYSLVFGESVLNDAVAIVLYRTLARFTSDEVTAGSIFGACGFFVVIFVGSSVIGVAFALMLALVSKKSYVSTDPEFVSIEIAFVFITPYLAYSLAEGMELSGIVSILFCGITMAHYTRPNLSKYAQIATLTVFKTLATLAETFVFIYMGVAAFLEPQSWEHVGITVVAILACLAARAANVYPVTAVVNWIRPPETRVPPEHRLALWLSGLRGAIAFALAVQSREIVGTENGTTILTTTLLIVLFTVLTIGGSTSTMVTRLNLRAETTAGGQYDEIATADEFDPEEDNKGKRSTGGKPSLATAGRAVVACQRLERGISDNLSDNFQSFDSKFIKPIFTRNDTVDLQPVGLELSDLQSMGNLALSSPRQGGERHLTDAETARSALSNMANGNLGSETSLSDMDPEDAAGHE